MTTAPAFTNENQEEKVILDLYDSLSQLAFSHSAAPSAVSTEDLSTLQDAIAALSLLGIHRNHYSSDPCSPVPENLSPCIELLVQQLLAPPATLFSKSGGAPCDPEQELADAGSHYREVSAAKLQLLLLLLQQLGRLELQVAESTEPPAEETGRERNKPTYLVGIVEIVEEGDVTAPTAEQQAAAQLQQLLLQVLLVCALYAQQDTTSGNSSSTGGTHASNSRSCASYDAFCSGIVQRGLQLATPWSSAACQQQCQQLLEHIAAAAILPDGTEQQQQQQRQRSTSRPDAQVSEMQQQRRQEQSWQVLLSCLLPQLLDRLRDTLMAQHRHNRAQERGEIVGNPTAGGTVTTPASKRAAAGAAAAAGTDENMTDADGMSCMVALHACRWLQSQGAYNGPGTFQRCAAARQLAWITQHIQQQQQQQQDEQQQQQQQQVGLLLPLLLAAADDPSPAVQRYGQAGLGWLGLTGDAASLRWHRLLLMDAARRLVVGCEQTCWATAMPAATSIIMALEGKNIRAQGYHDLLQELITEAQRNAHKPPQRLIFMGCLGRLLPCVGLYSVRHFAQLMPLLLEWTHAYDEASVLAAVQTLGEVVQYAWPRMAAHAVVVWEHLVEVVSAAEERHWLDTGKKQHLLQPQQHQKEGCVAHHEQKFSGPVVEAVVAVGRLLVACGGEEFAGKLSQAAC